MLKKKSIFLFVCLLFCSCVFSFCFGFFVFFFFLSFFLFSFVFFVYILFFQVLLSRSVNVVACFCSAHSVNPHYTTIPSTGITIPATTPSPAATHPPATTSTPAPLTTANTDTECRDTLPAGMSCTDLLVADLCNSQFRDQCRKHCGLCRK